MKSYFIVLLFLFLCTCTSYSRFDDNFGTLEQFYKGIKEYPYKETLDQCRSNVRSAKAAGNAEKLKSAIQNYIKEQNKLIKYLEQNTKIIDLPYIQTNKEKIEITSIKTGKLSFIEGEEYLSLEIEIQYKINQKIRKYDFIHIECNDLNDFCFSSINPILSDLSLSFYQISLNDDWGKFKNLVVE